MAREFDKIKLSNSYAQIPSYGDIDIRNTYTAGGFMGLSPWNDSSYTHSTAQLNLGYNSNGKLEVVTILNISNISTHYLHHNVPNCINKYNPKIYISTQNTFSNYWIFDDHKTPNLSWPESFAKI